MADPRDEQRDNNPAQVRGDISRRQTGKRPGMDPAAAPLETDSEAGGNPLSEEEVATARASQRDGAPPADRQSAAQLSYGTAMRPADPVTRTAAGRSRLVILLAILIVVVLIIVAFI